MGNEKKQARKKTKQNKESIEYTRRWISLTFSLSLSLWIFEFHSMRKGLWYWDLQLYFFLFCNSKFASFKFQVGSFTLYRLHVTLTIPFFLLISVLIFWVLDLWVMFYIFNFPAFFFWFSNFLVFAIFLFYCYFHNGAKVFSNYWRKFVRIS